MHLPLLVQTRAQRSASLVPSPPASRSRMPPTIAGALAAPAPRSIPAGSTIGHAATHLPQRVQASRISSTRSCRASTNDKVRGSFISGTPPTRAPQLTSSSNPKPACALRLDQLIGSPSSEEAASAHRPRRKARRPLPTGSRRPRASASLRNCPWQRQHGRSRRH
jgi:hypothetical protein